jgi:hypothetical protein
MDSFSFRRGRALFSSDSPAKLWRVTFEDEGPAGYLYACDRTRDTLDESILDSMLLYNNSSASNNTASPASQIPEDPSREYLASIQWSRDGLQCVLYIEGNAQAFVDFTRRLSFCRANFPNFASQGSAQSAPWRSDSHQWDDAALEHFEAGLYT